MTDNYLSYSLHTGYIHNWLVAGPQAITVDDLARFQGDDFKQQIAQHYYEAASGVTEPPVHFEKFSLDGAEYRWDYVRCLDDHFVDLSAFYHTCHYLRAWASADLVSPVDQTVTLVLTTNGPADLWLNDDHVHRQRHMQPQKPRSVSTTVNLKAGQNRLLVRFEAVAVRECPYVMALQLLDFTTSDAASEEKMVRLPISDDKAERYHKLENFFEQGYFDRDTFVSDDHIILRWAKGMTDKDQYTVRLVKPPQRIYAELQEKEHTGQDRPIMRAYEAKEDAYEIVFLPDPLEFYEQNVRIQRRLSLNIVRNSYADAPYETYAKRRVEALRDAAMRNQGLYSEIAKMQGNWWSNLKPAVILEAIEGVHQRRDCSDFDLIGLLGLLYRFSDHESFPNEVRQPLEDCILGFRYWADEPGDDGMWFWSENHQILFHTCEILAGQRYPDRVFSNSGLTGQQHREKGEALALAWLQKRAEYGFQEWDSNGYFAHDLVALSHLLDLADTEAIWELAAVLIDKLLLTIALNSYKGVFGSTHGRSYTPFIKGGYLEATSGIGRLMWGLGIFNRHIMGPVSLACCQNYNLPEIIANIAADLPEEGTWAKERHAGEFDPAIDNKTGAWEVNKVTYKTADYMLCSAQDYRPGQPGYQEHIWQATMGPDAVVFATHPACLSEDNAHRPGFWHGNVTLPRVAQWKDLLIAVHNLPADDWLGFTHAYFPRYAFDEHTMQDGWAFARKGDGYLALTASQGLRLTTQGQNAYRELRSYGQHTLWLCQMGRQAEDGSFKEFKNKVLTTALAFDDLSVNYTSLRGDTIAFGWEGPLLVNDETQPLSGFKHYDGPYCAAEWPASILAMGYGRQLVRLNLGSEPQPASEAQG